MPDTAGREVLGGKMEHVYGAWNWVVRHYYTNTELALWATIGIFAFIVIIWMLYSPGFRRFMTVVIVVALLLGALLVKFGGQIAEELAQTSAVTAGTMRA